MAKKTRTFSIENNLYEMTKELFEDSNVTMSMLSEKIMKDIYHIYLWNDHLLKKEYFLFEFENFDWYQIWWKLENCFKEFKEKYQSLMNYLWIKDFDVFNEMLISNNDKVINYCILEIESFSSVESMFIFKDKILDIFSYKFQKEYQEIKQKKLNIFSNDFVKSNSFENAKEQLKKELFIY